jgi:hypothetical protein
MSVLFPETEKSRMIAPCYPDTVMGMGLLNLTKNMPQHAK